MNCPQCGHSRFAMGTCLTCLFSPRESVTQIEDRDKRFRNMNARTVVVAGHGIARSGHSELIHALAVAVLEESR